MGERAVRFSPDRRARSSSTSARSARRSRSRPAGSRKARRRRRRSTATAGAGATSSSSSASRDADEGRSRGKSRSCAALRRGGRAARGRRHLQRQRLPAYRWRHRQEPRRAEGEHRPALGHAGELAVTVAWELSWYQYRVSPDSAQPVRLERRGHELDELDEASRTGTRRSRTKVASSRRSRGSSGSRGTSRASGGASCALRAASRPRAKRPSRSSVPRPRW